MSNKDPQVKEIEKNLVDGQVFYPATRTIQSEWPKMATRGNGKGKKPTSQACKDQDEYDAYMSAGKKEVIETTDNED